MIALLQRVDFAEVSINKKIYSSINKGLLVLLGINKNDELQDIEYLINKIINLRIFNDENNKMNLSISDVDGEILVVSQFTLISDTKKGRRPSFVNSAEPQIAEKLYKIFLKKIKNFPLIIKNGKFGSHMDVKLINNGPVTFILNSRS